MGKKKRKGSGVNANRRETESQNENSLSSVLSSSSSASGNEEMIDKEERRKKQLMEKVNKSVQKLDISNKNQQKDTSKQPISKLDAAALDMYEKAMQFEPNDPALVKMLRGALKLITNMSGNEYLTICSALFVHAVRYQIPELVDQQEILFEEKNGGKGGSTAFIRDVMASLKVIENDKENNTARKLAHERAVFYSTVLQDLEKAKEAFEVAIYEIEQESKILEQNIDMKEPESNISLSSSLAQDISISASASMSSSEESNINKEMKNEEIISLKYHYANFCDRTGDQGKAEDLFRSVILLDPNHVLAINNLATILIEKKTEESYDEAETLLKKAQELNPGFPAYNLACIASLRCLHADCENYLLEALATNGIPSSQDLIEDGDFESVRKELWFQKIVEHISSLEKEVENQEIEDQDQDEPRVLIINPALVDYYNFSVQGKSKLHNIRIYMGSGGGNGATTGSSLWNAAMVTMRYLESKNLDDSENFAIEGKKILDLSAGTGLVGIVRAKLGAIVTMTDIGEAQLNLMKRNVEANGMSLATDTDPIPYKSIQVVPLAWKKDSEIDDKSMEEVNKDIKINILSEFDIIVASDLLYIAIRETLQTELVETIQRFSMKNNKGMENENETNTKEVIVCFEERSLPKEKELVEYLSKNLEDNCDLEEHEIDEDELCLDDIKIANQNSDGEELGLQDMFASADQEVAIRLIQYSSSN